MELADQTQTPDFRNQGRRRSSTKPSQTQKPQNEHNQNRTRQREGDDARQRGSKAVGDEGEANVKDNYYYYQYYYY